MRLKEPIALVGPITAAREIEACARRGAIVGVTGQQSESMAELPSALDDLPLRPDLSLIWPDHPAPDALLRLRPLFIEVDVRFTLPDRAWLDEVWRSHAMRVVLTGVAIDHDDDPAWVSGLIEDAEAKLGPVDLVALSILPDLKQPLQWLTAEAGAYEEDVTLHDLKALVAQRAMVLDLHGPPHQLVQMRRLLPQSAGVLLRVGAPSDDGRWPAARSASDALRALDALIEAGLHGHPKAGDRNG